MKQNGFRSVTTAASALLLLGLLLTGCGSNPGNQPASGIDGGDAATRLPEQGAIPGRYIVILQVGVQPAEVARAHGVTPDVVYSAAVNGFAGPASAAQARALTADSRVQVVEPDRVVSLIEPMGKPPTPEAMAEILPTGVNRIDAELDATSAAGIGIAIIDTGIDLTHPDLNVVGNVTFVKGTKSGKDDNGHGSHVAGIAAAKVNGTGVRGVAPGARLFAVKVLDRSGSGWLSWVIGGVDWVTVNAASKKISVANMSLGFQGSSTSLNTAIHNSVVANVTYTVAAGNSASNAATFSPANHPDVICVSAIADSDGACGATGSSTSYGADDSFATFSNYGSVVDIAAPGVSITSTYKSGGYATMSGTSMASPHVAGAAALYVATHPGTAPANVRSALISLGTPQSPVAATPDGTGRLRGGFSGDPDSTHEPLVDAAAL